MKFGKVLITGGVGFLGSHLVDALLPLSERVVIVDAEKPRGFYKRPEAVYRRIDIEDACAVRRIIKREKPDYIFHLAAHNNDRESLRRPVENARENILGTIHVLEAAKQAEVKRVIFASSGVVYGQNSEVNTESSLTKPQTPYAISKLAGEHYARFYDQQFGLSTISLRIGNVYGPRQDVSAEMGVVGILAARFLRGDIPYMHNDGQTIRDYIYVDDVIEAFLQAANSEATGSFNIGTGEGVRTIDMHRLVQETVGVQGVPEYREEVQDRVKQVVLDSSKAKDVLQWKAKTMMKEGIEKTVEWYRKYA